MQVWRMSVNWLVAALITGCATIPPPVANPAVIVTRGQVQWHAQEGGFWSINDSQGRRFEPLNLPPAYRKHRLPVEVHLRPRPDRMTLHLYGQTVEIISIRRL